MSSFQSNPILSQIPLVVTPGSFQKPKPVTLPYDFQQLPPNINEFKDQYIPKNIENLKNLVLQETQLIEKLQKTKNGEKENEDEAVVKFKTWERQIKLMAPGYFGKDGSVGVVMTPTKHFKSDSDSDSDSQAVGIADSTKPGEANSDSFGSGGNGGNGGNGSVAQDLAGLKI
ncbi:unnamed protein product [Ambrosiozyma monospora]|uniref:Unnamed protein product n=1 Tax=Ambrosiozyma monospora TaxID=43982 RepID=A0A9W6Z5R1_AMBMO|nr:unnamed protein product [Ambrosiozyma monospora]